jgi:hypothetical protein
MMKQCGIYINLSNLYFKCESPNHKIHDFPLMAHPNLRQTHVTQATQAQSQASPQVNNE